VTACPSSEPFNDHPNPCAYLKVLRNNIELKPSELLLATVMHIGYYWKILQVVVKNIRIPWHGV